MLTCVPSLAALESLSPTPGITPYCDVIECIGILVYQWIQETQGFLSSRKARIVEQSDDRGKGWWGGAGPSDRPGFVLKNYGIVVALCSNVWDALRCWDIDILFEELGTYSTVSIESVNSRFWQMPFSNLTDYKDLRSSFLALLRKAVQHDLGTLDERTRQNKSNSSVQTGLT